MNTERWSAVPSLDLEFRKDVILQERKDFVIDALGLTSFNHAGHGSGAIIASLEAITLSSTPIGR